MSAERSERLRRPQRLDDRAPAKPHATAQPGLGPGAVLALQRTAGNRAVQQLLGARLLRQTPEAPAATAAVDPWPAIKAIDAWRVKADARLDGTTAWETANWIEFLGRTSSDPILSLADSELAAITSNAVGNLLTEVGREGIQKGSQLTASAIGAAIGTAAEPGVGTVIGFVVGVLIEAAASYMFENFTGKRDAGETAAEAAERVTRVIQKQHTLLTAQHKLAAAELETLVGAARDRAEKAETQDEVDAIAKWATGAAAATLPPPELGPSYPLASELLRFWALEHAADLSSARPGTDPGQFESVVADTLNGLEAQPSLFVFQTRAEWDRAGLDHKADSGSLLAAVESLIADVGMPLVGTTSAPAFTGAGDAVQAAYQGHETEFSGFSDPDKARWFIFERNRTTSIDKDWLLEKLQQGRVRVYCALEVSSVSDSVAVDAWHWRVEIDLEPGENPNPGPGGVGDPLPMDSGTPADTLHIAFDSSPSG